MHYDIARAHFVETTPLPATLVDRFDACLWIRLRRLDAQPFGLHRVADFYVGRHPRLNPLALVAELSRRAARRLIRSP